MIVILSLIFPILLLSVGYAIAARIVDLRRKKIPEAFALSLGLGSTWFAFGFFLLSLCKVRPGWIATTALGGLVLGIALRFWPERFALGRGERASRTEKIVITLAMLAMVAALGVMMTGAVLLPFCDWDAFSIWGLKAKVLAALPLVPRPEFFSDVTLSFSHLEYPLLVPFLLAAQFNLTGLNEAAVNGFAVLFYIGFGTAIYSAARWKLRIIEAVILTTFCMTVPSVMRWANAAMADMPLAFFIALAVCYLVRYTSEQGRDDLILASIFSAAAGFTKNEGSACIAIYGFIVFIACVRRKRFADLFIFGGIIVLLFGPWWLWSRDIPRTFEDYGGKLMRLELLVAGLGRLKVIRSEFLGQFVWWDRWGLFWLVLLMTMVLGWRGLKLRTTRVVWTVFLMHLLVYGVVYMVTPWDVALLFSLTTDRLLLHLLPIAAMLIAYHLSSAVDISSAGEVDR